MSLGNKRAFTLVELMIVVTIVSVLAALAAVAYTRVTRNQRHSEALNFIAAVHASQAMYRSRFSRYCTQVSNTSAPNESDYDPGVSQLLAAGGGVADWSAPQTAWRFCMIETPSQTRFQYMMMAGSIGTSCQNPPTRDGIPTAAQSPCTGLNTASADWYWITMRGDLDGDAIMSYTHSHSEMRDRPPFRVDHNE
jgi:type IV pilus assembly protein PilA